MRLTGTTLHLATLTALTGMALAVAAKDTLRGPDPRERADLDAQVNGLLDVSTSTLQNLAVTADGEQLSTLVVIDGQPRTLELALHSVRSIDFRVLAQYETDGPLVEVEPPPVITYKGTVVEWPEARVRASYDGVTFSAMIVLDDDTIAIQPIAELGLESNAATHVIHRASDYLDSAGHTCGVEHQPGATSAAAPEGGDRETSGTGLRIAEIGFDADEDYFDIFNTVAATVQSIEDMINTIETRYEVAPISMTYEVTTIVVRTVPGTYTTNDPDNLLDQFEATWDTAPESSINRDTSHLVTGKNLAGTTLGIASTFTGCSTFNSYGLTQYVVNPNTRVAIASHELGHNWGALHCDGCAACASCCRIMCSGIGGCSGLTTTFGCTSANAIANYANAQSCLTDQPPSQSLPFCEDFEGITLEPEKWIYVDAPVVTGSAVNPPSGIFSLTLDASSTAEYTDDEIRSNFILMSTESNVVFSYYTQHRGVEAGEELVVEFWTSTRQWQEINRITSNGVDQNSFIYHEHVLPTPAAYHNEFRIRFRAEVDGFSDDWFIDDVSLDCFPPPNCEEPCNDGDPCTENDECIDATNCLGTPVDCSGVSDECSLASCDPIGIEGNCDTVMPVNEGGGCNGGDGYCSSGTCADGLTSARLFMAADGQQNGVNAGGQTTMVMSPGTTATVGVFIADNTAPGPTIMNGYQIVVPYDAEAQPGASGTISYVDDNPGMPGGGSVVINTTRSDWLYVDEVAILTPTYTENTDLGLFGVFYSTIDGLGIDVATMPGIQYLLQFEITASGDAEGEFLLPFNLEPNDPPLSAVFNPVGQPYPTDQYQPLRIIIGDGLCSGISDCADLDMNGIRDDNCLWWACTAGQCLSTEIPFGDMGGQFGLCPPDGTADGNDRFHALNCFSDTDPDGGGGYTCEQDPPTAFNVDAGGQFGSCNPDGVCDGNDAFAALNAFGNTTTCSCPLDGSPAPDAPTAETRALPPATQRSTLKLSTSRTTASPGDIVEIDVLLGAPLADLRGYQLHLAASGGKRGALELIDIAIPRLGVQDPVSGQALFDDAWTAFNLSVSQMLAGTDRPGVAAPAGTYLATFTYRVSDDARGRFIVEALHDASDDAQRTYLFPTAAHGRIDVVSANAAVITIDGGRRKPSRSTR